MRCRLLTQYAIIMVEFLAGLRKIKLQPEEGILRFGLVRCVPCEIQNSYPCPGVVFPKTGTYISRNFATKTPIFDPLLLGIFEWQTGPMAKDFLNKKKKNTIWMASPYLPTIWKYSKYLFLCFQLRLLIYDFE